MNWDVMFFLRESFITIITMACIHAFLHRNKAINKDIKIKFVILSDVLMLEGLESYIDHILSLRTDNTLGTLRIAVSAFGYTVRPLMLYVVLLIMLRDVKFRHKNILLSIPTIITFVISQMAFFTKWVFYYDEVNRFHGGPLRYVFFVILMLYFVAILVVNSVNCKKNKAEGKVLFGVIGLLSIDWILALVFDEIGLHSELESLSVILYFMYFLTNFHSEKMEEMEQEHIDAEHRLTEKMLDQSIETLAYTIDAKDKYTKGHSFRVAKYSRMIAGLAEKPAEECRQIYLAGLLHDIGKISISSEIINKKGKLSTEEYEKIKTHPVKGALILEKMKSIPYLQNGAKYHHERYDGKGYPFGLKGTEIPEMARIIAVADAYDAMTSYRSYRSTMEKNRVKQEIWKGIGTQFDPLFAKYMIALIDADPNYEMREFVNRDDDSLFGERETRVIWPSAESKELEAKTQTKSMQSEGMKTLASFIKIDADWCTPSKGFAVAFEPRKNSFTGITRPEAQYIWSVPVVLVYASDDGNVLGPNYEELGVINFAGYGWRSGPSLSEESHFIKEEAFIDWDNWLARNKEGLLHTVCSYMEDNELIITIDNGLLSITGHIVVPRAYKRRVHIAFSGFLCDVFDVKSL